MARTSLAAIISITRGLIDDPEGATTVFTDDEIQLALDSRREEARYVAATEKPTISPGGTVQFLTFDAPCSTWDTDTIITDASFNVLTPATVDYINARWTLATQPRYPVRLLGWTYDTYGAAADLLRIWSRKEAEAFDVSTDGVSLSRSQKSKALQDRADAYLAKARARSSDLVRTDEAH